MRKILRLPSPVPRKVSKEWGKEFAAKRKTNPKHSFSWKHYEGNPLDAFIKPILIEMTDNHCSFCGGFPLGETGRQTIEHFKPKKQYPRLAYLWENLFLCCDVCQSAKGGKFDKKLLKPDQEKYQYEDYFINNYKTGEILPNPTSSPESQERASCTIELYKLNDSERIKSRKRNLSRYWRLNEKEKNEEFNDFPYRYFLSF